MREIKFRAWDKSNNEMRVVVGLGWIHIDDQSNVSFEGVQTRGGMEGVDRNHYTEDVEVMQFTGLKDRNGTEIYEGDFCKHNGHLYKIVWYERWAGFGLDALAFKGEKDSAQWEDLEVVGNVHEHPDLLPKP